MEIHSYPSIYALGHRYLTELLLDPVVVQEKVDGSQFSWAVLDGHLHLRSKGAVIYPGNPPALFAAAIATVEGLFQQRRLPEGMVFRGEALSKPKHNALKYERVPVGNVVVFDVDKGGETYLTPQEVAALVQAVGGLEVVPTYAVGVISDMEGIKTLLQRESFLGGVPIEGVVIKNYSRFGPDKKPLMGKFVSEAFKEVAASAWKQSNPGRQDVVEALIERLRTEARWRKSVQHMREAGTLAEAPQDIGPLLRAVVDDVLKEEEDAVKEILFKHFWKDISRGITRGLPEWYKEQLAAKQFETGAPVAATPTGG